MLKYTGFIYCPRCARETLETFHENGLKCKECGFIYFHNTASASGGILFSTRGILLIRRAQKPGKGLFDVPGGFVNYGEQLESALKREIREELNIEITDWQYVASFPNIYRYENVVYHTSDAFFTCHYDERQSILPNDEIEEIVWAQDINSVPLDMLAFDSTKAVFSLLRSRL